MPQRIKESLWVSNIKNQLVRRNDPFKDQVKAKHVNERSSVGAQMKLMSVLPEEICNNIADVWIEKDKFGLDANYKVCIYIKDQGYIYEQWNEFPSDELIARIMLMAG
jgi:hypothetical protein